MEDRPRVDVLGPVVIRGAGDVVGRELGGRPARLLVALALRDGATLDQLADAVWAGSPPPTHRPALHVHLGTVRKALGVAAAGDGVVRRGDRYALDRTTWDVDAALAADLLEAAHQVASEDPRRGAALAGDALALWRGVPASVDGEVVEPVVAHQLEALRREGEELLVDCLLAAGDARRAESTALQLVADEPLREHRWGQLLRARYLAGRTADAVATYQEARRHLADTLGIQPGHVLRALEAAALTHDRARLGLPATPSRAWPVPAAIGPFVGRSAAVDRVATLVAATTPVLITGAPGAGKSRLALETVARLAASDIAWIDAAALDADAASALREWARLRPRGVVVLDGAEHRIALAASTFDDVRRHAPALGILVTSRVRLPIAAAVEVVGPLAVPDDADDDRAIEAADAVVVLRAALDLVAPDASISSAAAARIARRSGGLPLVLRLVADAARALPAEALAARTASVAADVIGGAVASVLHTIDPVTRNAFTALAPVAAGFDVDLGARMTGLDRARFEMVVVDLVDHGLVVARPKRLLPYAMLDPIGEVALRRLGADGGGDAAEVRLIDACIARARSLDVRAPDGMEGLEQRMTSELPRMRRALEHAAAAGEGERALQLVCRLEAPLYALGWWAEKLDLFDVALAVRGDDTPMRARAHALRARAGPMHLFDAQHAERAEAIASTIGDDLLLAFTRSVRAVGLWWSGDLELSMQLSRDAAARFRAAGRDLQWCDARKFEGVAMVAAGAVDEGVGAQREALDAARRAEGGTFATAHGLAYLGHTQRMLGDDDAALACWTEALELYRRIGNRGTAIHVAIGLGDLLLERTGPDACLAHLSTALELITSARASTYETWAWTVALRAHRERGDTVAAMASARRALEGALRGPTGESRRLGGELAALALQVGDVDAAARLLGVVDGTPDHRELPFPPHTERRRLDTLIAEVEARAGPRAQDLRTAGRGRSLAEAAGGLLAPAARPSGLSP